MHWILQSDIFKERGLAEMAKLLIEAGNITFSVHKLAPFTHEIIPDISPDGKVMVYGTTAMRDVAIRKCWKPGFFDVSHYSYQDLIDHWGRTMLNYDLTISRFDEVVPPSDPFFIKPDAEQKTFAGYVTSVEDFQRWQMAMYGTGMSPSADNRDIKLHTMVALSTPKNILREIRFWVIDGQIVTQSQYRINNETKHEVSDCQEAADFVARRISQWQPARAFVIDVALLQDQEWKVVEINTINCSGLYCADVSNIIRHIEMMKFEDD